MIYVYVRIPYHFAQRRCRGMMQEVRQASILNILHENGSVKIKDLAKQFNVSIVTVRRDLDKLAADGLVTKVYGGAVMPQRYRAGYLQILDISVSPHRREKELIGVSAAALVQEGETVLLDIGETVLEVAKNIRNRQNITILTPSVPVLTEMASTNLPIYSLGGCMRNREMAFYGSLALYSLSQFCVDKAFIGCAGLTIDHGITDYSSDSAELHTAVAQRAKQSILVTDSSKFERDAFAVIGPIDCVDVIITDSGISSEYAEAIRSRGVELIIVDV